MEGYLLLQLAWTGTLYLFFLAFSVPCAPFNLSQFLMAVLQYQVWTKNTILFFVTKE